MLNISLSHIPGTVDACPLDGRMHLRFRARKGLLRGAKLIYQCNKNLWHIQRHTASMRCAYSDSELDYFYGSVPLTDRRFAYIFALDCADGKTRYLCEEGLTEHYDHDLGYFNFFQYCSQFSCDMMQIPRWVPKAVCYQIFPERFARGSVSKDEGYITQPWGELPTPKSYFGGDLWGIAEHLEHLEKLGCNVLYLTPVFCSPTNHKYEITDYSHVDPAFGGDEALLYLTEQAHQRGIRVMLDGVFNHCSWQHPFFLDAQKRGEDSPYYCWFLWNEDGSYETFGSVKTMPKLNTAEKAVIDYFCTVAREWMARCGIDGWRLDVSDEISHRFLRAFREAVLEQRPDAIVIGEDWHRATRYLNGDEYDGIMNYGLTKALLDLLAFGTLDASGFRDRLLRLYHSYSLAATEKMLNLLGSHDTHRFLTRVGGEKGKLRTAAAILFFYPGIPCIYYGDEIGLSGGYDPDCRRCFDWQEENWDRETYELFCRLSRYKKQPALSSGRFTLEENGGIQTLGRIAPGQSLYLRVNGTDRPLGGLEPYGFEIIETKEEV